MPTTQSVSRRKKTKRPTKQTSKPTTGGVLDRITALTDLDFTGIKLGIYGMSGTGKTRAVGSFAALGPMLHMICSSNRDGEARSIRGTKGVDVVTIEEPDDLPELLTHAKETGKYETVVLDHCTEFGNMVLASIIGIERLPEQSSWGLATMQQYAQMGLQLKTYLRDFFDFDGNCILVGQERTYDGGDSEADDESNLKPTVSIATTPSVAGWIAPACDYFVRTYKRQQEITKEVTLPAKRGKEKKTVTKKELTGKVEYCVQVGPDPTYLTKFRVPQGTQLPDSLVVPEDASVYEILKPYLI